MDYCQQYYLCRSVDTIINSHNAVIFIREDISETQVLQAIFTIEQKSTWGISY